LVLNTSPLCYKLDENFSVNTLAGMPIVEIRHTRLQGWGRVIKRILDFFLAAVGSLILIPLSLLVGLIIKLIVSVPFLLN
jgi:lipopolysaccharide/colanic/teichoic acid biosynthesis glycosyltransferase